MTKSAVYTVSTPLPSSPALMILDWIACTSSLKWAGMQVMPRPAETRIAPVTFCRHFTDQDLSCAPAADIGEPTAMFVLFRSIHIPRNSPKGWLQFLRSIHSLSSWYEMRLPGANKGCRYMKSSEQNYSRNCRMRTKSRPGRSCRGVNNWTIGLGTLMAALTSCRQTSC